MPKIIFLYLGKMKNVYVRYLKYSSAMYPLLFSVTVRTPRGFRKLTVIDLPRRWRRRYGGRNTSLGAMAILTCVARARIYLGTSIISSTSRSFWLSSPQRSSTFSSGWSSCCCRCLAPSKEKREVRLGGRARRRTDDRRVEKGERWTT